MAGRTTKTKAAEPAAVDNSAEVKELQAEVAALKEALAGVKAELTAHCAKSAEEHKALEAKCDACCEVKAQAAAPAGNVDLTDLKQKLNQLVQQIKGRTKPGWPQF